jgi:hypothetical protein
MMSSYPPGTEMVLVMMQSDGGGDPANVDLLVQVHKSPSEEPASHALLFGLALLVLNQTEVIAKTIERLVEDGLPSEAEAIEMINLLLQGNANAHLN